MGSKRVIPANQGSPGLHIISAGVMTGTTTITSATFLANNFDNIGLEVTWTGSAVGTISVLGSVSNTTFYPLTFNPVLTQPAGTAGGYLIDLNQIPFPYLKVQYVNTSSTGVLNVWLSSKDVN